MSIRVEATEQQKVQMANRVTECQVLGNLLAERQNALDSLAREILETNGLSPKLYALRFNVGKDLWDAELKPGVLTLPGQEVKAKLN